jgi:hypothetical protein
MAFGGSRSAKTFLLLFAITARAIKAPGSRHAVMRFAFNHLKASVIHDTWPKMLDLAYPDLAKQVEMNRTDWFAQLPNGSQVWFGGLDDKEATEKILGQEHATIFLNECSQISNQSRLMAMTRLAQKCTYKDSSGNEQQLALRMLYDCNPPSDAHWSHSIFVRGIDPETRQGLDRSQYASLQMNPRDNLANLPEGYLRTLESMPARMRKRFLDGEFGSSQEGALWTQENIDRYRVEALPDLQRIIVSVDPSGSDDTNNTGNDEIGIVVTGLGVDGKAYVLEDCSLKAGPGTWGRVVGTAFDRHAADLVVGETNYGGAMVKSTIQVARPNTPYKGVNASRGKVVRAEPISALYEQGKVRHAGTFPRLEDEMCAMTTKGYTGEGSPNRVDALVWGLTELFPGLTKADRPVRQEPRPIPYQGAGAWMA